MRGSSPDDSTHAEPGAGLPRPGRRRAEEATVYGRPIGGPPTSPVPPPGGPGTSAGPFPPGGPGISAGPFPPGGVPTPKRGAGAAPVPPGPGGPGTAPGPEAGKTGGPAVPVAPARRLVSFGVALFAALLTVGLVTGAHISRTPYALVVLVAQVLFVLAWTLATRPPAPRVIALVGLVTAVGVDLAAVWTRPASLKPLTYLTAAAFVVAVLGQLGRREGRVRVGESLATSLSVAVGVTGYATLVVLARHQLGAESITVCLLACGVAVLVARLADTVWPYPRLTPQVPRGALGLVLGAMLGTVAAALAGSYLVGVSPGSAALAGLLTATVAVLVDLSTAYAEAGRSLGDEGQARWLAASLLPPLGAFALAAPAAYAVSALLLVPRL